MGQLAEHVTNHPFLASGLLAALFAVLFFELRRRSESVHTVSPADAVRLINNGAVVVDVRKPAEFEDRHIVNARNVELDEIGPEHSTLKKLKNKVLIAVCENGINSSKAAEKLRKAGFEKTFALKGGLNAWRAENLPLVK